MLSLSQLLERVLSRRGLQGGEPGGVAGGPGGCSQLAGCTSPCQSQQSRVTRACHRAQPRLRASAAIYHRTFQGRGCLSMGKANRASAVARSWGSGSSIMARTERSSEDRPADEAGPCRARVLTGPLVQWCPLLLATPCQKLVIVGSSSELPLTSSELRGQVSLAQLLPALPTMGQFHVTGHFQDGETQTRKDRTRRQKEAESAL